MNLILSQQHFLKSEEQCLALASYDNLVYIYPMSEVQNISALFLMSFLLVVLGLAGVIFYNKNFLVTMMFIETMYMGVMTSYVYYGVLYQDTSALIYGMLIVVYAACESAVGLGLLVSIYRYGRTIGFSALTALGG